MLMLALTCSKEKINKMLIHREKKIKEMKACNFFTTYLSLMSQE